MTHLRFLTVPVFQYFSNVGQKLLIALLRVPTYDIEKKKKNSHNDSK